MTLTRNKIFFGILIFGLIANLLVYFNLQDFYLRAIFSFAFLTTIPGLLIMLILKVRKIGFWEYLVYSIGLSISFLMFGGLTVNWILPLVGINKPLSLIPFLISFDIFLLIFWIIAYKRNKEISLKIRLLKLNWLNKVFFIIPMVFPVLSILGAITLNNQGPNYLTMIMLSGIAIYIFLVVLFRKKLDKNIYPWAILMMSVSLLLMLSLRSWHIPAAGDIGEEYYVFQLTKENFHWGMSNWPKNAYNACLSITILPTIFSSFLAIHDEYVFKSVFPLIFSLTAVGIYLFYKRYVEEVVALIAGFFFISQMLFIEMSILARQEISLFFFTLALLILFNEHISPILKEMLFLIFGFSMVVSHYTTTYVALAFFIFTYLTCFIFRKTESKIYLFKIFKKLSLRKKEKSNSRVYYLRGTMVLLLVVFTLFWNAWLTQTSGNLVNIVKDTFENIGKTFSRDLRSESTYILNQFNIFYKPKDQEILLKKFAEEVTLKYKNNTGLNLYPAEKYKDYELRVIFPQKLPPKINSVITSKIYLLREVLKKSSYIFILVGTFCILFGRIKILTVNIEYKIIILGCLIVLVGMTVLPIVTLMYPLERLYQQTLIALSLPAILGCLMFFKFLKEKSRINLIIIIFSLYFLFSFGFIPQIIGDQEPVMQLNNFGSMYDSLYTHEEEVKSIKWLSDNYNEKYLIYVDKITRRKLAAFGGIINTDWSVIMPSIIEKDAYVYSNYANTTVENTCELYGGTYLHYNFPTNFLNQNKNLVYNNGGSKIFK
jgi:uncharacterized membrane protein